MDRVEALDAHLRNMSAEEVARILATLLESAPGPASWDEVLERVRVLAYRPAMVGELSLSQTQLVHAVATVAEDLDGLRPAPRQRDGPPVSGGEVLPTEADLGPVGHEAVLARIGAQRPGSARDRAEKDLAVLVGMAVLWPDGRGGYHLADDFEEQFGAVRAPPDLMSALTEHYDLSGMCRVARGLGLDPDPAAGRGPLIEAVLARLSDSDQVLAVLADAPRGTGQFVHHHALHSAIAYAPGFGGDRARATFPPGGSADPSVDWLAERGLVVPVQPDGVMVPREAALVVRAHWPAPFTANPPAVVGVPVDETVPHGAGGAVARTKGAVAALLDADDRLLACVRAHGIVLKAGVVTERDRRRLIEAAGGEEDLARVWIESGRVIGLLLRSPGALSLSTRVPAWTALRPERRIAALAKAWTRMADTAACWPCPEQPRPRAVTARLRDGVARALDDLPEGTGLGVLGERLIEERSTGEPPRQGARWLTEAALWYRPFADAPSDARSDAYDRVVRALREAELLGLVAYGSPTLLGRALSRWRGGREGTEVAASAWAAMLGSDRVLEDAPTGEGAQDLPDTAELRELELADRVRALRAGDD